MIGRKPRRLPRKGGWTGIFIAGWAGPSTIGTSGLPEGRRPKGDALRGSYSCASSGLESRSSLLSTEDRTITWAVVSTPACNPGPPPIFSARRRTPGITREAGTWLFHGVCSIFLIGCPRPLPLSHAGSPVKLELSHFHLRCR
jgi:hypothetical protein